MTTLTLSQARATLPRLAKRLERDPDAVIQVTRRGRPTIALVSAGRLAALLETLEILDDTATVSAIRRSRREAARGKTESWTKVRQRFGV